LSAHYELDARVGQGQSCVYTSQCETYFWLVTRPNGSAPSEYAHNVSYILKSLKYAEDERLRATDDFAPQLS
jgi:hypothetical protein